MSSLKDKFDDFREEPQYATWKQLLKRLNAEMPVRRKGKYLLWVIPALFIGTTAAWLVFSNNSSQPVAFKNQNKIESSDKIAPDNNISQTNTKKTAPSTAPDKYSSNTTINVSHPEQNPEPQTSIPANPIIPNINDENNPANAAQDLLAQDSETNPGPAFQNTDQVPAVTAIDNKPVVINKPPDPKPLDPTPLILTPAIKPIDKEGGSKFVLEIYFAGGGSNIFLRDPLVKTVFTKQTIADNKKLRNGISKIGLSYTTGFGVKMNVYPNVRIKSGFYITQVSQTLYYNTQPEPAPCNCGQATALLQIDPGIKESDISNKGDTISVGNSETFTNKYSLREIPFILDFMVPMVKYRNLSYVLSFGVSYMYMRGVNTRMPDADNVGFVSTFDKTSNIAIFPSYTNAVNAIAGFGLTYRAAYNVEWSVAPQFKMAVTSLSKNDHWFREYPWQVQLAFGVGKRF